MIFFNTVGWAALVLSLTIELVAAKMVMQLNTPVDVGGVEYSPFRIRIQL